MNAQAKRRLSNQAQVAKALKQYCKGLGVTVSAKSESFSLGDSVRIRMENQPPAVFRKIEKHAKQYQYGHFDGMSDMYEYSNKDSSIPQSKYVFVDNDYSDEVKQKAWDFIRARFAGGDAAPQKLRDCNGAFQFHGEWPDTFVYRFLRGAMNCDELTAEFWDSLIPTPAPKQTATVDAGGARIEEHTHTKKGFQMFIVILSARVDRDTFGNLRDRAKSMGGWYSRQWGKTPGGFAFKDQDKARLFADTISGDTSNPGPDNPTGNPDMADKLRDIADRMQNDIDHKLGDRLTNTPKRQRQAASARLDGEQLQRTQTALRSLADMHEAGTVPPALSGIVTKKAVFDAMRSEKSISNCGYYDAPICLNRPADETPTTLALWALLAPKTPEELDAETLRLKLERLQRATIPGFFPTPATVIERMLDLADIRPGHSVLEPSAGAGAIVDAVKESEPLAEITTYEINAALREILELKGYAPGIDFMENPDTGGRFDRIVMNPPFEKLQDVDHVRRAFDCLKPGGRLVAIMSPSGFLNATRRAKEFREWFLSVGGKSYDLPAGSFKDSGTSANTKLIRIEGAVQ